MSHVHSYDSVCMASTMASNCGRRFVSSFQQSSRRGCRNGGSVVGTGGCFPCSTAKPKYLIHNHPVREYIAHLADVGLHTCHNFWSHPAGGSLLGCVGCLDHGTGCAKVAHFGKQAQSKENISTLQVAMDHIVVMQMVHSTCYLLSPGEALVG